MTSILVLLVLTGIASIFMAVCLGANDASNSIATSVNSGTLSFKQALFGGSIMEFVGAVTLGGAVATTISKGIISEEIFTENSIVYISGMMSSLFGASLWLAIATWIGWPVSTTQSVIGALISFGLIQGGGSAINVNKIYSIIASWFISPIFGAFLSSCVYVAIKFIVLKPRPKPVNKDRPEITMDFEELRSLNFVCIFVGFIVGLVSFFIIHENPLTDDLHIGIQLACWAGAWIIVASCMWFLFRPWYLKKYYNPGPENQLRLSLMEGNDVEEYKMTRDRAESNLSMLSSGSVIEVEEVTVEKKFKRSPFNAWSGANRPFVVPLILTDLLCAFAHGANDSGNATGFFAGAWEAYHGSINTTSHPAIWITAIGAAGIGFGVLTFGQRVIKTSKDITPVTPISGCSATIGVVITTLIASALGLPVSSSNIFVGTMIGVGLVTVGRKNVDWKVIGSVGIGWLCTIPFSMGIGALIFFIVKKILRF